MVLWNFMLNQNLSCSRPSTTWSICVLLAFNTCSYTSRRWCSAVGCCRGCAIGITWTLCIETEKHLILINDAIFCRNTFVWYVYILCFLTALHVAVVAAELVNALESMLPEVVTQYWLLVQVEVPHLHVFEEHVFEESLSHPTPPQRHWHIPRLENGLRPPSHETPEQGSVYIDYSRCN